jgi:hypothetical protein
MAPSFTCGYKSPDERKISIYEYLISLSGMQPFDDPQHPVFLASKWIVDDDPMVLCPGESNLAQRYALVLLYFYTSGDSWKTCTRDGSTKCRGNRFLSGYHECSWGGVTCDASGRVTKLNLGKSMTKMFVHE